MAKKDKLEKDYTKFNKDIEKMAEEEINQIRGKIANVEDEAEKIGEALEHSGEQPAAKQSGKKVNT